MPNLNIVFLIDVIAVLGICSLVHVQNKMRVIIIICLSNIDQTVVKRVLVMINWMKVRKLTGSCKHLSDQKGFAACCLRPGLSELFMQ